MRLLIFLCVVASAACTSNEPPKSATPHPEPKVSKPILTVYSGRSALLVEPLLQQFAKRRGIELKLRFDKSTEKLANRLAMEGKESPADLFFAQAVGYLSLLGEKGFLQPLPETVLQKVTQANRSKKGFWVGTSGRLRVMVYSKERVKTLPKSLSDLADPRFKGRIGWAPGNASLHAHVSAMRSHWGEGKTRAWLQAMKANEAAVYPKNSPQVRAVSSGEIDIGWVNHYYLHKLRAQDPSLKAANASFAAGDIGNLVMLAGVGIPKHAKQAALARELIAFLLSQEGQAYFAQKAYEYPSVAGVGLHADVPPLGAALIDLPQAAQTDLSGSLALLRELRLQ